MMIKMGDRQILEKPIPQIIENGKLCIIVEKKRNWQIWEIVETSLTRTHTHDNAMR